MPFSGLFNLLQWDQGNFSQPDQLTQHVWISVCHCVIQVSLYMPRYQIFRPGGGGGAQDLRPHLPSWRQNLWIFTHSTVSPSWQAVSLKIDNNLFLYIQCLASIYSLSLCRGHSWRVRLAKQEMLTPPGYLVSPLVCRGPWMSTVVLYCSWNSDSASVLLYFTLQLDPSQWTGAYLLKMSIDDGLGNYHQAIIIVDKR